jgi:hypothetical protein
MTFEELTSSGMASRLALVRGSDALTLGYREQRAREDEALAALDGVFNGGWARATIERDVDDFFVS